MLRFGASMFISAYSIVIVIIYNDTIHILFQSSVEQVHRHPDLSFICVAFSLFNISSSEDPLYLFLSFAAACVVIVLNLLSVVVFLISIAIASGEDLGSMLNHIVFLESLLV